MDGSPISNAWYVLTCPGGCDLYTSRANTRRGCVLRQKKEDEQRKRTEIQVRVLKKFAKEHPDDDD